MNWLILLLISFSIVIVMSVLSRTPSIHSIQPGNQRPQPNLNNLLAVQHCDSSIGEKLLPLQRQVLDALEGSQLETARRICLEMRSEDSAVVELNVAKIALDQVERHGDRMTPAQLQEQLGFVRNALERAEWFIEHHRRDRYCEYIEAYLEHQKDRLTAYND